MISDEANKLLKKANNYRKTGKAKNAKKIYESMLETFNDIETKRRTTIELFRVCTKLKAKEADDILEEIIMLDDLLPWEKNIIIIYYIEVLKAYELAEALVEEVLLKDPDNKTTLYLKQRIKDHYFAIKISNSTKRISIVEESLILKIIDRHLYSKIDLDELVGMINKILTIPNNINKLPALLILEKLYDLSNMQLEKKEVMHEVKSFVINSKDKVAAIRSIIYLENALKEKAPILSLFHLDYIMLFEFPKGELKYKGDKNNLRISALHKINDNVLVMKTHGFKVYNIPLKNAGVYNNRVVNYLTVICEEGNNDIKSLFPSKKLFK